MKDQISTQTGVIPEGYIKHKNRIYPNHWRKFKLKDLLKLEIRPAKLVDEKEYDLITVKRNYGGIENRSKLLGKEIKVKSQFLLETGDFVISKRQISHGACAIVGVKQNGYIVSNEYNVFKPTEDLDLMFFNYFVQQPIMKHLFYKMSVGVHIEKMLFKTNDWLKQVVFLPSFSEQQKIVSILSTWDKAIVLKEKLVVEKKIQKKGLMELLLSREKRLVGFDGKWKEAKLGELIKLQSGFAFKSKEFSNVGIPIIRISNIVLNSINLNKAVFYPNNIAIPKDFVAKKGDLLIAMSGATTGKVGVYNLDSEAYINQRVGKFIIKNIKLTSSLFINQIIKSYLFESCLNKVLEQGAQPNISGTQIENFKFLIPSDFFEQLAIAEILTNADKEIELLEKEVVEAKEQKKGLMQKLLTGEIRVKTIETN